MSNTPSDDANVPSEPEPEVEETSANTTSHIPVEQNAEPPAAESEASGSGEGEAVSDGVSPASGGEKRQIWGRTVTLKTAVIAAATILIIGLAGGAAIGYLSRPAVSTTAEYQSMKHKLSQQLSDTKSELGISQNNLDAANQRVADIKDREAALVAGEAKLKADQAALDQRTQQVQSTQFGDGVHVVGANVTPGVYSISSSSNCYYAWMTGTGSDADIVENNIVSGPATVTLKPGDIFETSRCGTWTKVG